MGIGRQLVVAKLREILAGERLCDAARRDEYGLNRCLTAREEAWETINTISGLRLRLEDTARRAFDEQRAKIFLVSSHIKRRDRARPLDHCVSETTLDECLALLPKK